MEMLPLPIEKAPKDGTDILAFIPYSEGGGYFFERLSWGFINERGVAKGWRGDSIGPYEYRVYHPKFFIPIQSIPYPKPNSPA